MKLTEVSKERTFNLEISETDLRLLFGAMAFRRGVGEGLSQPAYAAFAEIANYMTNYGVSAPNRDEIVQSDFDE